MSLKGVNLLVSSDDKDKHLALQVDDPNMITPIQSKLDALYASQKK